MESILTSLSMLWPSFAEITMKCNYMQIWEDIKMYIVILLINISISINSVNSIQYLQFILLWWEKTWQEFEVFLTSGEHCFALKSFVISNKTDTSTPLIFQFASRP